MKIARAVFCLALLTTAACGTTDFSIAADDGGTGGDADPTTDVQVKPDADPPPKPDAGEAGEPGHDAGSDAVETPDSGHDDAGKDAGKDAAAVPDSGLMPDAISDDARKDAENGSDGGSSSSDSGSDSSSHDAGHDAGPPVCTSPTPTDCSGTCVNEQTDPLNCGACGHSCQGGTCLLGVCQPFAIASGVDISNEDLAVTGDTVFWASLHGIMDVSVNGGASHTFYNGGTNSYPGSVQADGLNVYWVDGGFGTVVQSPIVSGGSTLITLAHGYNPYNGGGLAIDSTYAYWTDVNLNEVFRSTLGTAGIPTVLSTNSSPSPTIATTCPALPGTCDAADVYWTNGNLMNLALNNGSPAGVPTPLVTGPETIEGIVTDSQNVYWFSNVGGMPGAYEYNLYDVPLAGGTVVTLATQQIDTHSIMTDGTYLYWTNETPNVVPPVMNQGTLNRTLIAGAGQVVPTVLQAGNTVATGNPAILAQDATSIYWTGGGTMGVDSGYVWKLAK